MKLTSQFNAISYAIVTVGLALAGGVSAHAADAPTEALDTLEVLGDVAFETGDILSEENTLSSQRISRETLSRSQGALAEVIARETGIQYRQSGGFGSFSTVSIRAASAAQTGVYLDGILLNSGGNPVIDLATLEALNLGRVDIYRGGTPSQLGHGGMGGAINLISQRANANEDTHIRLEAGSFGHVGAQLSHQTKAGNWDLLASLSHRQSDNDFSYINKNGTPLNTNDDRRENRENADAQRSSLLVRAGIEHRPESRTDITLQVSDRTLGVTEWRNLSNNASRYTTQTQQLQLAHIINDINGWNSRLSVYTHRDNNHYQDPLGQIGLGSQNIVNDIDTQGVKSYWEYPGNSGTLALSIDFRNESIDSIDHRDVFGGYLADRAKWLATAHYTWFNESETLTITPALRWNYSDYQSITPTIDGQAIDSVNSSTPGAQIGFQYAPGGRFVYTANVGNYFRTPSFGELFGSVGLIDNNPNLNAEKGINADVGFSYQAGKLNVDATVFVSLRDELIVTAFDSRGAGRPLNAGNAQVFGVELESFWQVSDALSFRGNITWQSAKSIDKDKGFYDRYLPGEAQLSAFAQAEYRTPTWSLWYELDVKRDRFYDRANILPAANSAQHSIGIGWDTESWQFNVTAKNLSDANVEDFNGFPKPGRHFSINLTRSL